MLVFGIGHEQVENRSKYVIFCIYYMRNTVLINFDRLRWIRFAIDLSSLKMLKWRYRVCSRLRRRNTV